MAGLFSQTDGVVVSNSFWWEPKFKSSRDTLHPSLLYRYVVQGKPYSSSDIYVRSAPLFRFLDFFVQSNDVATIEYDWTLRGEHDALQLTRGKHHTVYFNPSDPQDSFLLQFPPLNPLPYLFGAIGLLCASLWFFYRMRALDKIELDYENRMADADKMFSTWKESAKERKQENRN